MEAKSHVESDINDPQLQWGIKSEIGVTKKGLQFYESFTLDGVYYKLYDTVCLFEEGEAQPYIGKIVRIWERGDGKKKVRILWFFHPSEIANFLGDHKPLEKEIFLATGEGVSLSNVNYLEAIVAKRSVICTSKDERNPQPSKDALEEADFIFYRTFDVETYTISEKLPDNIAGIEVKFLLNRKENQVKRSFPEPKANRSNEKRKAKTDAASLQMVPPSVSVKNNTEAEHHILKVTRRPGTDRSKWFKGLPWEDRLQKAHEKGTLMFLQNFDRTLTSTDIEDVIYVICKHSCTAKVIPSFLTYHNPHYGQAYVIFKTCDAADEAIQKINEGCLMLSNGSKPLSYELRSAFVASKGLLEMPPKATRLRGHLSIKRNWHTREEMRKAVSTSHCSQPNTIEYEMAMDWFLLQEKAALCFDRLYEEHGDELEKVAKKLRTSK